MLTSVLCGNVARFTEEYYDASVHNEFEGRSRYLLVPLLESMRLRALLMIGRPSPVTGSKVFQNSPVILSDVLYWLGYHEDGEVLWEDANNDFERAGVSIVPLPGADPNNLKADGSDREVKNCNKAATWRPNDIVNSELIFGFLDKKNAVLPYNDPMQMS